MKIVRLVDDAKRVVNGTFFAAVKENDKNVFGNSALMGL